jgi:seryl-tRNA synthetase
MFDIKWIRDNPAAFDAARKRRGLAALAPEVLRLDKEHRAALTASQEMQTRRNAASKLIGAAKSKGDEAEAQRLQAEVADLKGMLQAAEDEAKRVAVALDELLAGEPNILASDVPDGADAGDNAEVRRHGEPRAFAFDAKEHFDLGEALGLMDFAAAARMSGARFVVLKGPLARLERALGQWMLDVHTKEFGYIEVSPPLLVRDQALYGTAQLPKFAGDLFHAEAGYWLVPTAEVPLTNLAADAIIDEAILPLRWTALTPCFRAEAGAAGKDTRGMIRQHQFHKVELVSVAAPEQSAAEHARMTECAETILKRLELPFRTMLLCAGDTGFAARKTYDIEVWLPGQKTYREISSCSDCGDFQARRMQARCRPAGGKGTRYVHTLNGSGVAVGRALIAILENYQEADGGVAIPDVLRPYFSGMSRIAKP